MDEITIFWTNTAKLQRNYIFKYWNKRNKNKNYSKKLNLDIRDRTELLKSHPNIGKLTIFKNTKMVVMRHYAILYQIQYHRIIITGFWDNRQDPDKLTEFLKE